jgi:signal transduction histidine kinase
MITHRIRPPAWLVVLLLFALATLTGSSSVVLGVRLAGLLIVALLVIAIEIVRRKDDAARVEMLVRECTARAEVEAANRSKDDFFLTISHELRGPLSAILSWVHLLRSGKLDEGTAVRALETIERNARSEARLVTDMLEVSRIIGGKIRLDVRPVELATIIAEAADSVRPAADARDIHVEVNSSAPIGRVTGDPGRLQQVMENLFSNAIKFTPRGGHITADVNYDAEHATIAVHDTGQGIRSDFLPHVFERFGQANGTATRLGGLGLGLAIVRHLVELHGGRVKAASAGDGQGSTFTVMLPISAMGAGTGSGTPAASGRRIGT